MGLVRLFARSAFATIFLTGGWAALTDPGRRSDMVQRSLGLPEPTLMVRLNGGAMVAGGAALALGIKPRVVALELAALLVPTTYVGHQFWAQDDEASKRQQRVHFDKNVSLIGALLTYALSRED